MTSEEHIQLESSSAPVSSNGFHDAQHVQTALDPSPVSEPMTITSTHTAEVLAQTQERDLSATVEEVELTTVLDRTLVEEGNGADASMPKASGHRPLIPESSYYFGPPSPDSAYGTAPTGHMGVHHPREILRVERDYTGGELIQFAPIYPLELEGRITPTQFLESINSINELLISAHTMRHSFLDNMMAIFSFQISKLFLTTHFEKEMMRLQHLIDDLNIGTFNPVGLNILWPRNVAFLYLEIEYYVSAPAYRIAKANDMYEQ